ncbi:aminotransferase class IV [Pseudoxanthomonas daejeonensis]|uniref:aminotransferase class IV n=1 Tax=Pseudoxanthomonas daejeonensis TaxID=266062 RepID=UPI001F5419EC|nr:aminotransferase class IV [Pseudoxanthomonas daejeonensis]UNK56801.1 aminotransferase class IV [Pseudoxanthomonas daejeonensis]
MRDASNPGVAAVNAGDGPIVLLNGEDAGADALRMLALVNYGHFTSLQVRDGAVQGLGLHLDRLRQGNAELFDADFDADAVRGWMRQAAQARGGDCSMRVTLFSRQFDHRHALRPVGVDVLVSASAPLAPTSRSLRLQTRVFSRPVPQLKHVGTFPLVHHRRQALRAGYDDALFVDGDGPQARVSEGSFWNVGFWDGRQVVWPDAPALRGTSERLLQQGLAAAGVGQQVRPVVLADLAGFQAAFAANANGVQPVASIDGVVYPEEGWEPVLALLGAAARPAPAEPL